MLKRNCLLDMSENESGDELTVRISGEIDHHSAVWVRGQIDERISRLRPRRTVLELSGIDFMDSSGIGLIMGRYARMKAVGGELVVQRPNERIRRIFEMAGIERIVRIEEKGEEKHEA